jgi:hypothetical protein
MKNKFEIGENVYWLLFWLIFVVAILLSSCTSYPLQSKVVKVDPKAKSHIGR